MVVRVGWERLAFGWFPGPAIPSSLFPSFCMEGEEGGWVDEGEKGLHTWIRCLMMIVVDDDGGGVCV